MDYAIKSSENYTRVIERANANKNFMPIWHDFGAPKKFIGDVNYLCEKYGVVDYYKDNHTAEECVYMFIEKYLNDGVDIFDYSSLVESKGLLSEQKKGRSIEQIGEVAHNIMKVCSERNIHLQENKENDNEFMVDLIIGHACFETVMGRLSEERVRHALLAKGKNVNSILDEGIQSIFDSMGCDILLVDDENKIYGFVQVKPVSFLFGKSKDMFHDRAKCYINEKNIEKLVEEHKDWFRKSGVDTKIRYVFYNKQKNYEFVKFPNKGLYIKIEDFTDQNGSILLDRVALNQYPTVNLD